MKKKIWLAIMILLYIGTGINHFVHPAFYEGIMPSWLPAHALLNQLSGIAEIVLALLLIFPLTQRFSAWMIIAMLVVFLICIHIPMVLHFNGWNDTVWWIAVARLPLQYVLIRWAWRFTRGKMVCFWGNNRTA
jgi:uncharacterized membrane protein